MPPHKFDGALATENEMTRRGCTHGGCTEIPPSTAMAVVECSALLGQANEDMLAQHYYDDKQMPDLMREQTTRELNVMEQFWTPRQHMITSNLVSTLLCMATDAALDGNLISSRNFLRMGVYFENWLRHGTAEAFWKALHSKDMPESLKPLVLTLRKTRSDRGMILYLNGRISCSCLGQEAARMRALPPMGRCFYCHEQDAKAKLLKCSRCRMAEYCSKECQLADWKNGHKLECRKKSEK